MMMLGVHPTQADEWKFIDRMNQVPISSIRSIR